MIWNEAQHDMNRSGNLHRYEMINWYEQMQEEQHHTKHMPNLIVFKIAPSMQQALDASNDIWSAACLCRQPVTGFLGIAEYAQNDADRESNDDGASSARLADYDDAATAKEGLQALDKLRQILPARLMVDEVSAPGHDVYG